MLRRRQGQGELIKITLCKKRAPPTVIGDRYDGTGVKVDFSVFSIEVARGLPRSQGVENRSQ